MAMVDLIMTAMTKLVEGDFAMTIYGHRHWNPQVRRGNTECATNNMVQFKPEVTGRDCGR
eukprot:471870-Prorocentrum_lima.AAC.1